MPGTRTIVTRSQRWDGTEIAPTKKLQLNIVRRDAFCGVYQSIVSRVGVDANFRGKRGKNGWIHNQQISQRYKEAAVLLEKRFRSVVILLVLHIWCSVELSVIKISKATAGLLHFACPSNSFLFSFFSLYYTLPFFSHPHIPHN